MNRCHFLCVLLAGALPLSRTWCQTGTGAASLGEGKGPNILMIAVDDLRPELGCYGKTDILSPNIDRLAASGITFQRAYVQQAVCGPSRISILSGLRPDSTRVFTNSETLSESSPGVISLPRHFKNHGYHTVSLGKIFHHPEDSADAWSEPVWRPFGIPPGWRNYRRPENLSLVKELHQALPEAVRDKTPLGRVKGPPYESLDIADNVYPDGLTADMAVHALGRLKEHHRPFFLAVGFYKPHLPFVCPTEYWELYDPSAIELPGNDQPPSGMPGIAYYDSEEMRAYFGFPSEGRVSDDEARKLIHGYRACVTFTDAQIGRVLDELDRLELADSTVVMLWGDHGWHLREQGIWGKATNFENATRIPLIVRRPVAAKIDAPGNFAAGRSSDALVEAVDLYPTLCELAGLPRPGHLEGASFVPVLNNPDRSWKKAAFSQFPRPINRPHKVMGYTMRTQWHRFTRWVDLENPARIVGIELYDHASDPRETRNLAEDRSHRALLNELTGRLEAGWRGALPQGGAVE